MKSLEGVWVVLRWRATVSFSLCTSFVVHEQEFASVTVGKLLFSNSISKRITCNRFKDHK